ncbi:MAG: fimbrillin family protein [Alistipes sp.]|nr:fimbrillin family protein [Alistipes sp.]
MKKFLLFAVAVLALSCSKDESGFTLANDVAIDPTITRATEVDFESGDVIGLTISTAESLYADNAKMVFNGESFLAEGSLKWYEDMGVESTLTAYYPYSELKPTTFSVQADQSGDGYLSSDFMMAKKEGVTPTAQAVNMTFYHKMTKIVINLTNEYNLDIEKVTLCNSLPTALSGASRVCVTAPAYQVPAPTP